ncbi:glycoside hydrolase superfamily [Chytriomyces sp. MP71]|nr:glycoside hydrolase superfamily [Chytriomyces sp. MP71]
MAPDPHQQPSEKEQKKQQRNTKWIVLSVALVVLITAGAVIGYFVSKKNNGAASANSSNADGAASSGIATTQTTTQTGNASVSPVGSSTNSSAVSTITGSASVSTKRKLFGYYGANAIANGVDIIKGINGRTTAPTQYQGSLATYCATGYYDTINLAFLNIFGGGNNHFQITFASFSDPSLKNGLYIYNGDSKESNDATVVATFAAMGKQIQQCQAGGTKIVLSLGGDKVSAYTFVAGDGAAYATLFYNMFLGGTSTVRPFGAGVVLDG